MNAGLASTRDGGRQNLLGHVEIAPFVGGWFKTLNIQIIMLPGFYVQYSYLIERMSSNRCSRRRALQLFATSGVLSVSGIIGGATADDGTDTDGQGPENGAIVFVYDDGPIEDYTQAFPAHQEFDAPATVGIVSEWVGDDGRMDTEHLDAVVEEGWEIASHTKEHTSVAAFTLTDDVEPDDTELSATGIRHGHHEGEPLKISDGEAAVIREIAGLVGESGERRIELADPVGTQFEAGKTEIRHPPDVMHEALGDSKDDLEEMGYDVSTLLAPYDTYSGYSDLFVPEYYEGVANARPGSGINDPDSFDPYETRREYFIEFTTQEAVKQDLDEIADDGSLGVVGAHTFKEEVSESAIEDVLSWVDDRDIETMTLREAIETYD